MDWKLPVSSPTHKIIFLISSLIALNLIPLCLYIGFMVYTHILSSFLVIVSLHASQANMWRVSNTPFWKASHCKPVNWFLWKYVLLKEREPRDSCKVRQHKPNETQVSSRCSLLSALFPSVCQFEHNRMHTVLPNGDSCNLEFTNIVQTWWPGWQGAEDWGCVSSEVRKGLSHSSQGGVISYLLGSSVLKNSSSLGR